MKRFYSILAADRPRSLYNAPQRTAYANVRAVGGALHLAHAQQDLVRLPLTAPAGSNVFTLPEGQVTTFHVRKGQQLFVAKPFGATSRASVSYFLPEDLHLAIPEPQPRRVTLPADGKPRLLATAMGDRPLAVRIHNVSGGGVGVCDEMFPPAPPAELTTSNYLLPGGAIDVFVLLAGKHLFGAVLGGVPVAISILYCEGLVDFVTSLVEF